MKAQSLRLLLAVAAAALLLAALGCAHHTGGAAAPAASSDNGAPAAGSAPDEHYVIGQADEIEVQVWQEPDLSRTAIVRSDGMIDLPLINDVKAAGLTVKQLRELLTKKYADLVTDPVVSVMVSKPYSATFFVTGKVSKPGEYPLFKQTTVLQAIATAGGFTEWAKTNDVTIVRKGCEPIRIDYNDIVSGDMSQDITLQRGDTVVVP